MFSQESVAGRDEPRWFATTHWSVVLNAANGDSSCARQALSTLCQIYWSPIHQYIRSRGYVPADADDLTQAFFARFLEKQQYRSADRERGRFRSFVLACLKHFLSKEHGRASAQKRGGGWQGLSLDEEFADGGTCLELADERTADRIYEQNWALALLARARAQLESKYAREGKGDRFALLEKFLPGEESASSYAEAARALGVAEGTIKSDVHRLKRRYAACVREEIANTVASPADVEEELRHLRVVLGRR